MCTVLSKTEKKLWYEGLDDGYDVVHHEESPKKKSSTRQQKVSVNSTTNSSFAYSVTSSLLSQSSSDFVKCGRQRSITENEYRARYWGQMLDTLRRTIDEIYSACEADDSEVECKVLV